MDSMSHESAVDEEFLSWCLATGVVFGPLRAQWILPETCHRGVFALKSIDANVCILRVPDIAMMSCDSAKRDAALTAAVRRAQVDLSSLQLLAIHLLYESSKGRESFWNMYLRTLPRTYTTAMWFCEPELAALQVPAAEYAASKAVHSAESLWVSSLLVLKKLKLDRKWLTKKAFMWALSTLSSRTMHLSRDPAGALVPFGDLHNYVPPPAPVTPDLLVRRESAACCTDEVGGDGALMEALGYCIYTRKEYGAGEEILLCYGRHTNLELLIHYGFILDDNPHEAVDLSVCKFSESTQSQLRSLSIEPRLHANGSPSWGLLRALRLASLLPKQRAKLAHLALNDEAVNDASEGWALNELHRVCQETLNEFSTTIEEDEDLLNKQRVDGCMALAVKFRLEHKKILGRAVEMCHEALLALSEVDSGLSDRKVNVLIRQPRLVKVPEGSNSACGSDRNTCSEFELSRRGR